MKKKNTTQQNEPLPRPNPSPSNSRTESSGGWFFLIIPLVVGSLVIFGPKLYQKIAPTPTIICHDCRHVVEKASSTSRPVYKYFYEIDDLAETQWFCAEHAPSWDYAVLKDGVEIYFKYDTDKQCYKSGTLIPEYTITTNIEIGWSRLIMDTNGAVVNNPRIETNLTYTFNNRLAARHYPK
jgi:hypothetical protein